MIRMFQHAIAKRGKLKNFNIQICPDLGPELRQAASGATGSAEPGLTGSVVLQKRCRLNAINWHKATKNNVTRAQLNSVLAANSIVLQSPGYSKEMDAVGRNLRSVVGCNLSSRGVYFSFWEKIGVVGVSTCAGAHKAGSQEA